MRQLLSAEGFLPPAQPDDEAPALPRSLTEQTDEQLMELFSHFTEWANYLATRKATAEIEEAQADSELSFAQSHAMVMSAAGTVTKAKAERSLDSKVMELQEKAAVAKAKRKLLSSYFENVERKIAVTSRELTRRVGSSPLERRANRFRP